ncbi:MAG: hypothetical protein J7639_21800 [Paenibacillaceae bacterium]|nr:hypothetical protein [Paenibacillaceae bacterium]
MRWMRGISLKLFLVCFVFVLGSILLVSTLSYRYIQNDIKANRIEYANQMLAKVEQFLDLYFQLLQNTLNAVGSSSIAWKPGSSSSRSSTATTSLMSATFI